MITVNVKTLAGVDKSFDVSGDLTIKEFKEHIADDVNVPVSNQRIIYHGRVLQDEKVLNALDLDGKTLHLVEKAPTQSNELPQNNVLPPRQRIHEISEQQVVIGTVAVPVSELNRQEISDSMNRVLNRLGDIGRNARLQINQADTNGPLEMTLTLRDESSATVESPAHARLHNVQHILDDMEHLLHHLATDEGDEESQDAQQDEDTNVGNADDTSPAPVRSTENGARPAVHVMEASPRYFASVFERLQNVQQRLRPHNQRYIRILEADVDYSNQNDLRRNDTRFFDIMQNIMHMLSHAFHSLSDLNMRFDQAPPRRVEPATSQRPNNAIIRPPEAQVTLQFVRQSDLQNGRTVSGMTPVVPSGDQPTASNVQLPLNGQINIQAMPGGFTASQVVPGGFTVSQAVPVGFTVSQAMPGGLSPGHGGFVTRHAAPGGFTTNHGSPFPVPAGQFNLASLLTNQTPQRQQQSSNESHGNNNVQTQPLPFLQRIFNNLLPGGTNSGNQGHQSASGSVAGNIRPTAMAVSPGMAHSHRPFLFQQQASTTVPLAMFGGGATRPLSALPNDTRLIPVSVTIGSASRPMATGEARNFLSSAPSIIQQFSNPEFGGRQSIFPAINDRFLPCCSQHFAHRHRLPSSQSSRSNGAEQANNEPGTSNRAEESPFDMSEFEDTMEQLLRSILDNMRISRPTPPTATTLETVFQPITTPINANATTTVASGTQSSFSSSHRSDASPSAIDVTASSAAPGPSESSTGLSTREGSNSFAHHGTNNYHTPNSVSGGQSSVSPRNQWKANVPPQDWVAIIESDIEKQEALPPQQAPFSDAYLNGMPSKRRKMIAEEKSDLTVGSSTLMQKVARQSSKRDETGAEMGPIPDELANAFEEQLQERIERRSRADPNFDEHRFENVKKLFKK